MEPTASDRDLLREVAEKRSEQAFAELVSRYADLVHAAATRQARESHLAEEITQAVFWLVWQRAGKLQSVAHLGGWLITATRNVAQNQLRHEQRLKRRERRVALMTPEISSEPTQPSTAILPLLDDALARLGKVDRDVIVERFIRGRTHSQVAASWG